MDKRKWQDSGNLYCLISNCLAKLIGFVKINNTERKKKKKNE